MISYLFLPKVSVFSAGRAKLIINKYLSEFDTIFDPFSGFSGRMLGVISLHKQYIGQDISDIHINESIEIIKFLLQSKANYPEFIIPDMQVADCTKSTGEYQCLFTCPPYADKEQWQDIPPSQLTCDQWIDICLNNYKCKRYVFIVDNTVKYKDNIAENIINKSHLSFSTEKIIVIDK